MIARLHAPEREARCACRGRVAGGSCGNGSSRAGAVVRRRRVGLGLAVVLTRDFWRSCRGGPAPLISAHPDWRIPRVHAGPDLAPASSSAAPASASRRIVDHVKDTVDRSPAPRVAVPAQGCRGTGGAELLLRRRGLFVRIPEPEDDGHWRGADNLVTFQRPPRSADTPRRARCSSTAICWNACGRRPA